MMFMIAKFLGRFDAFVTAQKRSMFQCCWYYAVSVLGVIASDSEHV